MLTLAIQTLLTPTQFTLLACCLMAGLAVGLAVAGVLGGLGARWGRGGSSEMPMELSEELRREFNRVLVTRGVKTSAGGVLGFATGLIPLVLPISRRIPATGMKQSFSEQYARAGWPGGLDDEELFAIAVVLGVGFAIVFAAAGGLIQGAPGLVVGVVGLAMGPMLVSASLSSRVRERDKAITRTIPFVLDLLVLTMKAGASLQIAMRQVCEDYRGHPIGIEFAATLADIERGSTARQAFVNFAKRAPVPIVKYLVDEIVQSDELGRPIAATLERLADQTRVRRVQDATSTAGAAKVAVLAPGVLILFAVLIVLLAPFGLKILFANEGPQL
ncbi:MAG: type II secretion system F family protein [Phycisphaerales bacterium]|nr:type II secretion system F family protein [Phycisphaerales bacterium]